MISSLNRTINTEENTVNTVIIITIIGTPISCRRVMTIIDFHTHVLPNMDDGSTGAEESVEMLEMMSRKGNCFRFSDKERKGAFTYRKTRRFTSDYSGSGSTLQRFADMLSGGYRKPVYRHDKTYFD